MPWELELLEKHGVVRTRYGGVLSANELEDACRATLAVARAADTHRFLTDCRELAGGLPLADLLGLIDFLIAEGLDTVLAREAVVGGAGPEIAEKMEFWENSMVNRGVDCRRFDSEDAALAWLSR